MGRRHLCGPDLHPLPKRAAERDTDGMGYEVLDTGRGNLDLPALPSPPPGPVPLDDLDPATERPARRPGWVSASSGRRAPVVALAAAALVAGTVFGGWRAQRLQEQRAAAARSSTLSAMALVTSVDTSIDTVGGRTSYADLTVQLFNAGPLPLQVVTSGQALAPRPGEPVVRALGGASTVPAGGTLGVSVRVAVDCSAASSGKSSPILVPVRTADGVVRWVAVSNDAVDQSVPYGQAACAGTSGQSLLAQLAGSVSRPTLRLTNDTGRPLSVALDVARSPFVAQAENFSVLRLTPSLPLVLAPRATKELALQLTPWSCPAGLSSMLSSQFSPYIVLQVGVPGSPATAQEVTGVDLSLVWGAALARECS